ncbi:LysR family transcriptional regulator [Candidimonas nitroreducens]|uniref:HTH lysR-type domain-containing protein n=1 Tax=Candidimonas nitroreducens TaxID=683354 RepID=A0A225LX27_9BURK|nr:LysR family transcriptional regulator [Candidimonas nitroreducens]OWT53778.1 hypothetical protein CEY11_23975 [Candidimonas nitroreducens]
MHHFSKLRIRHLQAVVQLHETRNVHRAAEQLFLTQSAVSKLLIEAERILESRLFIRSKSGMQATEAGAAVAVRSKALLAQLNAMQTDVAAIEQGALGRIRLGTTTFSQHRVLLEALTRIREQYARLSVSIQTGSHDLALAALQQGRLDCVITRLSGAAVQGDYAWDILYGEPIRIVCSKNHPLAKVKRVRPAALAQAQWVLPPVEAPLRAIMDRYFVEHRLRPPKTNIETLSILHIELLLTRNLLLSPLPGTMAEYLQRSGRVGILDMDPLWFMPPVGLVYRHSDQNSSALLLFRELLGDASKGMELVGAASPGDAALPPAGNMRAAGGGVSAARARRTPARAAAASAKRKTSREPGAG